MKVTTKKVNNKSIIYLKEDNSMNNGKYTVEKYKQHNPQAVEVFRVDRPHPEIEYDVPIVVYYNPKTFDKHHVESIFSMFKDGEWVPNPLRLPCNIRTSGYCNNCR